MQSRSGREFQRDHVLVQSFSCYFASFLYLLGYNLSSKNSETTTWWGYISLIISIAFFVIAFILIAVACFRQPPQWANRILRVMDFPIWVASIGCVVVAFATSIGFIPHDSIWFPIFFYGGFLFLIAIIVQIISRFR